MVKATQNITEKSYGNNTIKKRTPYATGLYTIESIITDFACVIALQVPEPVNLK